MTLTQFIEENREAIDDYIHRICDNCRIDDDEEREEWIENDEGLYLWAKDSGVEI